MIFPDGAEGLLAPYLEGDTNMKLDGISLPNRFWPETESKFHDVTARREDKYWFVRYKSVIKWKWDTSIM